MLYPRQTNFLRNISAPTAAERFRFHTNSVHMFQTICPGVFRRRELPKHSIFAYIKCLYYPKGKPIISEIFRHQELPKYSIFMCIECTYYSEGKAIFSGIFRHPQLPKYSIFISINWTYYTEGKPVFFEIFWHQRPPEYSAFMCIDCAYYTQGKPIFSEIFRHQQLSKDSFSETQCTCYRAANSIPWSIMVPRAAEIFHFQVFPA